MEVNNLRKKALFMIAILLASTLVIGLNPAKAEVNAPDVDLGEEEVPYKFGTESIFDGNISRVMETNTLLPGETIVVEGQFRVQDPDAIVGEPAGDMAYENVSLFSSGVEAGDPLTADVFSYDTSGDMGLTYSGNYPSYESLPLWDDMIDLDNDGDFERKGFAWPMTPSFNL